MTAHFCRWVGACGRQGTLEQSALVSASATRPEREIASDPTVYSGGHRWEFVEVNWLVYLAGEVGVQGFDTDVLQ